MSTKFNINLTIIKAIDYVHTPVAKSALIVLYIGLASNALYEGLKDDVNQRPEYVKKCHCKSGDKSFYIFILIMVIIMWICIFLNGALKLFMERYVDINT